MALVHEELAIDDRAGFSVKAEHTQFFVHAAFEALLSWQRYGAVADLQEVVFAQPGIAAVAPAGTQLVADPRYPVAWKQSRYSFAVPITLNLFCG